MKRTLLVALLLVSFVVPLASAAPDTPDVAVSLTDTSTYSQNFDTLDYTPDAGTGSTLPSGWALYETGTNANTTYGIGPGSGNSGNTYSFGATGAAERAFGGLQSGSLIPTIGVNFGNNTGGAITSLTVSYNCEQWRLGTADRTDRLDFQYSTDATSLSTGTWTDVDALDCLTTSTSGTAGARDGNNPSYRTAVSGNVTGLAIANGATFWLRWNDFNASGADDGLAVDDFSLTPIIAANQPIIPSCPASVSTTVGTAVNGTISATDADGTVVSAVITAGGVAGISLTGVSPAGSVGGTLNGTLSVDASTAIGAYNLTITFTNDDTTPQTATCSIPVDVLQP